MICRDRRRLLAALAWVHVWHGAGMAMPALHMTKLALFPHLQPEAAAMVQPAWGLVAATDHAIGWVLVVFNALALLNLGRVLMSREQIVRDEVRRLERRQARQQRWPRALPPGPWSPS